MKSLVKTLSVALFLMTTSSAFAETDNLEISASDAINKVQMGTLNEGGFCPWWWPQELCKDK